MNQKPMLSIVTVSYKSKQLLEVLARCIEDLNPDVHYEWLVVQNTPEETQDQDIRRNDSRFRFIEGPFLTQEESENRAYGSFHHAKALALGYSYARAEIVLVIDPDFFILFPNWIQHAVKMMERNKLDFFGAEYPSRRIRDYKNFPMVSCMFVHRGNLHRQGMYSLDFSPGCNGHSNKKEIYGTIAQQRVLKACSHAVQRRDTVYAKFWKEIIWFYLTSKWRHAGINTNRDTGCKIFDEYYHTSAHVKLKVFSKDPRTCFEKIVDAFLPACRRLHPRHASNQQGLDQSFFKKYRSKVDEYFFENELYAIHINEVSYLGLDRDTNRPLTDQKTEEEWFQEMLLTDLPNYIELLRKSIQNSKRSEFSSDISIDS